MDKRTLDYRQPAAPIEFPPLPHSKIGIVSLCCFAIWSGALFVAFQSTEGMGDGLVLLFRFTGCILVPIGIFCGLLGLLQQNRNRVGALIGFVFNCGAMMFVTLTRLYN